MLLTQRPPAMPTPAEVMVVTTELPLGDPGTPPHRHSGPVFGYMLEGEMIFELEGEPERVVRATAGHPARRLHDHSPELAWMHA
ncbi:MAG TPA: cupin domain-containing protein [Streptosporangiaceae bacterium]|nr:cupin domain-containing protein [Streptosporangiaceae bacterium]